jgi:hypothetical protein
MMFIVGTSTAATSCGDVAPAALGGVSFTGASEAPNLGAEANRRNTSLQDINAFFIMMHS